MNRLILKYAYPLTFAILAILAWVVYRRISAGSGIVTLAVAAVIVWGPGTFIFIYFWPRIVLRAYTVKIGRRTPQNNRNRKSPAQVFAS